MDALSGKTVLLVTHQVDFLPAFDSVLVSYIHTPAKFFNTFTSFLCVMACNLLVLIG